MDNEYGGESASKIYVEIRYLGHPWWLERLKKAGLRSFSELQSRRYPTCGLTQNALTGGGGREEIRNAPVQDSDAELSACWRLWSQGAKGRLSLAAEKRSREKARELRMDENDGVIDKDETSWRSVLAVRRENGALTCASRPHAIPAFGRARPGSLPSHGNCVKERSSGEDLATLDV